MYNDFIMFRGRSGGWQHKTVHQRLEKMNHYLTCSYIKSPRLQKKIKAHII